MAFGSRIQPFKGINLDLHEGIMPPDTARYIKNLVYAFDDTGDATAEKGSQTGSWKPLESTSLYLGDLALPDGYNHPIGAFSFKDTKEIFVFIYNDQQKHTIYRINGSNRTFDIVYQKSTLNFQLDPNYFIHQGGCWLEVIYITDPDTGEKIRRSFLIFTDAFNFQRQIAVEDSIATSGFDSTLFPYFQGDYDPMLLINVGVPTPGDCIGITEVPVTGTESTNELLFNTWQFRLRYYDVWGRPSEYGIISDMYIPGTGCAANSSSLPNCIDLSFDAPPSYINQVEVAFRRCNSSQWYKSDTLDLWDGSPLGKWWLRSRNGTVNYNSTTGKITYRFCAKQGCDPIGQDDTNRIENPLPLTSVGVHKQGKFIAFENNKYGFLPFPKSLKDNIRITVEAPTGQTNTVNDLRNIDILVQIHNPFINHNAGIYFHNNHYYFGIPFAPRQAGEVYEQFFANTSQQGFGGYLAGTNSFVISEEWSLDKTTGVFEKVTDFTNQKDAVTYFQRFIFRNVPKGRYVFRIFSNEVDPATQSQAVCQKTSTYTAGTYSFNFSNTGNPINNAIIVSESKELIVDVCEKDYDSQKEDRILTIWDLTIDKVAVAAGYVFNTNDTTQDQIGVELLRVDAGAAAFKSNFTDHNGFYFVASLTNRFTYQFFGYCNCNIIQLRSGSVGHTKKLWRDNQFLNLSSCPNFSTQTCNHILVNGSVKVCNSQSGVAGVSVILSRGKTAVTDSNGNFEILAFDDSYNSFGVTNPVNPRVDNLYFVTNTCLFNACDGGCVPVLQVVIQKCTSCVDRTVTVQDTFVSFQQLMGLLSGGVYPAGVTAWDWLWRPTFVQPLGNITIPSVQQTQMFAPSRVRAQILPGAIFPSTTKYLTFWIGPETTIETYITWIVDFVQFVDNTGLENDLAPTQIKIFYSSLNEYNLENNFNTTTNWQFLTTPAGTTTQTPFTTDQVLFLLNGDGTFFSKSITALVKYDQAGQFFLIDYNADLKDLKQNAIIRLFRPKSCTETSGYFEVCSTVKVNNGQAQTTDLILNFFDTYYINRQIPVPTPQPNTNPVVFINEARILGVPFEHDSPSDFWGKGCHNIGRFNVSNPQETVIYKPEEFALSGAMSDTGQLNFLNFFDDKNKFDFSETNINGIIAVFSKPAVTLVIGQNGNFVVGFNDNIARTNAQGQVIVPSNKGIFGQPQVSLIDYGCQQSDKMTIYEKDGLVQWLDTTMGFLIQHNFEQSEQVSQMDTKRGIPGGVDSWLRPKIKTVQNYNLTNSNKRYFHGCINPQSNEYLLTDRIIRDTNFINELRDPDVTVQETMAFSIVTRYWKGSYAFVPALFAELEGELDAQQFFSIINGIPYSHYNDIDNKSYGTIYGQPVNRVFEVVVVMDNLRKKKPLAIGVACKESQYFCDQAISETGQQSRMLLSQWIQASFGWYAPVLCDLSTPGQSTNDNVLFEGNLLVGDWIKFRLIGDPSADNIYSELTGFLVSVFPDGNNLENK